MHAAYSLYVPSAVFFAVSLTVSVTVRSKILVFWAVDSNCLYSLLSLASSALVVERQITLLLGLLVAINRLS